MVEVVCNKRSHTFPEGVSGEFIRRHFGLMAHQVPASCLEPDARAMSAAPMAAPWRTPSQPAFPAGTTSSLATLLSCHPLRVCIYEANNLVFSRKPLKL